jgi:hypothetical protein
MDTMTKELPEWVEKWIAEHAAPIGSYSDAPNVVFEADLRALLSQCRLCQREAVKYLVSSDNHEMPLPLYAEAKEAK